MLNEVEYWRIVGFRFEHVAACVLVGGEWRQSSRAWVIWSDYVGEEDVVDL